MFPESLALLQKVLPGGVTTVIDIGVAHGTPELYSAFPSTQYQYVLVEASPLYAESVSKLGNSMHAIVENVFCSDSIGTQPFIVRRDAAAKGSKFARRSESQPDTTPVVSTTLDALLAKHSLTNPCVIKIDVEGAELEVLRGATTALALAEAVIIETPIIVRMHGASSFGEIVTFLTQHKFALFDISEMSYSTDTRFLNLANGIFVKRDNIAWQELSQPKTKSPRIP